MSDTKKGSEKPGKAKLNPYVETVLLLALALGLAFGIQAWVVKPYKVPSQSMYPTFNRQGSRILVNKLTTVFGWTPKVGQVVVFHPPTTTGPESTSGDGNQCGVSDHFVLGEACPVAAAGSSKKTNYVKRIVAGPGDTLSVRNNRVIRNGKLADEPFLNKECGKPGQPFNSNSANLRKTITIPAGQYYMMGDNRCESNDSRYWGPVPRSWLVGPVFGAYWPINRIGGI